MALDDYVRKRDFSRTPEPRGKVAKRGGDRFVIQKHAASRLHFDFRLELDGVLKSWAVPKGPCLDPAEKRLAVEVEDHPLDYATFEGVIPAGEYGGGTVMAWDRGTWRAEGDPRKALAKGLLDFELRGERLHGRWMLLRLRDNGGEGAGAHEDRHNWLLVKHQDEHARARSEGDLVARETTSVTSGRTMEQIATGKSRVWRSNRAAKAKSEVRPSSEAAPTPAAGSARARGARKRPKATARQRRGEPTTLDPAALSGARRGALPPFVEVERATLVRAVPAGDEWLHELKLDGYRLLARRERASVRLLTRNRQDWTARFAPIAEGIANLPCQRALLDGEAVVLDEHGVSSFGALQQALSAGDTGHLVYFAFDLLHLDGVDLTRSPLEERKEILARLLDGERTGTIRFSAHQRGLGAALFREACAQHLEGLVSKRSGSLYRPGKGTDWVKTKCTNRQEVVIGGYTEPSGTRAGFGALLVGVSEEGDERGRRLRYAGKVGTGFSDTLLRKLRKRLAGLERRAPPFVDPPRERGVRWVEPELVAEVSFGEWTRDGRLRHPAFLGLREDKPAEQVVREQREPVPGARAGAKTVTKRAETAPHATPPAGPPTKRGDIEVAGVRLTHPDRVLWPEQGVTKRELASYYERVAALMLPHVAGRPLMLKRCPEGVGSECFYQKHLSENTPDAVQTVRIRESGKAREYLCVRDVAGLVALVQMGTLEIHLWGSRAADVERPDVLIFDLDPAPDVEWKEVVRAARELRTLLGGLGLESFVKTSGGKGLHVVVAIEPEVEWPEAKSFCRAVAEHLATESPDRYVANMSLAKRAGKIFVDYLRNGRGATAVAPYSTRATARAPIATPVRWEELGRVRANQFDLSNIERRLARGRDPWEGFTRARSSLPEAIRAFERRR